MNNSSQYQEGAYCYVCSRICGPNRPRETFLSLYRPYYGPILDRLRSRVGFSYSLLFPNNDEDVDLAAWSNEDSSPSPRPRRQRAAGRLDSPAAERPALPPADQERAASLLAELTRETCQLFDEYSKFR